MSTPVIAAVAILILLVSAPINWKATKGWHVGVFRGGLVFAHVIGIVCAGVWGFLEAGAAFAFTGVVGVLVFALAALGLGIFLTLEARKNDSASL